MKLKKGDKVKVIRGKDKGKRGTIEKIVGKTQVLIANVNQYKRHFKKRTQREKSEIVTITKPLSISNVSIICSQCGLKTKVGFIIKDKEKLRICKKCTKEI